MWLSTCPEKSAGLRQGDFLHSLVLTRLTWPLSFARQPEAEISKGQTVLLPAVQPYGYLVVSQCCTIENQIVVALAEVKSTQRLSSYELEDYEREEPFVAPEGGTGQNAEETHANPSPGYVFNAHALTSFGEYLPRLNGRTYIADFTTIQTYSGSIEDFQVNRVAAMTPIGRRALRIRLSLFWGRPEAEDENFLMKQGVPVGITPPVATATAREDGDGGGSPTEAEHSVSDQNHSEQSEVISEKPPIAPISEEGTAQPAGKNS